MRLTRSSEPPTLQRIAAIYDRAAPTWLQREGRGETFMVGETWRNDLVQHLRGKTLEIGVGAGDTLVRLAHQPHNVTEYTGIDVSMGMVEQAQSASKGLRVPVNLFHANAESMPMFADASFDSVTASMVFCTIPHPEVALQEICRVIKPTGRVVLIEHVLPPGRILSGLMKLFAPAQRKRYGCNINRRTIDVLQQHGFHIEQRRSRWFGVFQFIVARPPHCKPITRKY